MTDQPMIPVAEIPEPKFWAALKPLYDLLNTTPMHQFADAGMTLEFRRDEDTMRMHVRFQHAVQDTRGTIIDAWPVVEIGDDDFAELAYDVDVVVVPEPGIDPIHDIWPGPFPQGTPARESGV